MHTPGVYRRYHAPYPQPAPAVFLDRDGVIVEETGYLHRIDDIQIIPLAAQAIRMLNALAVPVIVVTNQAGIGRGYYNWEDFERVERHIEDSLAASGAHIDGLCACAWHPDGVPPYQGDHPFRKPNPGMLTDAAAALNLDLAGSWLVGDKLIDIECAIRAGLGDAILVRTGYGAGMESGLAGLPSSSCRIHTADNLCQAVEVIVARHARPTTPAPA